MVARQDGPVVVRVKRAMTGHGCSKKPMLDVDYDIHCGIAPHVLRALVAG